jgi:hypothetical protein
VGVMWVVYEIVWYGWWWALFVSFAFVTGYFFRWFGPLLTIAAISIVLVVLDVRWIFDEMRHHPENGRDADFIFWFGVMARLAVFNAILVPISLIGWRVKAVLRKNRR